MGPGLAASADPAAAALNLLLLLLGREARDGSNLTGVRSPTVGNGLGAWPQADLLPSHEYAADARYSARPVTASTLQACDMEARCLASLPSPPKP